MKMKKKRSKIFLLTLLFFIPETIDTAVHCKKKVIVQYLLTGVVWQFWECRRSECFSYILFLLIWIKY